MKNLKFYTSPSAPAKKYVGFSGVHFCLGFESACCPRREAISGSTLRRVRAPGALADDQNEATDFARSPELKASHERLLAAWQSALPLIFPALKVGPLSSDAHPAIVTYSRKNMIRLLPPKAVLNCMKLWQNLIEQSGGDRTAHMIDSRLSYGSLRS